MHSFTVITPAYNSQKWIRSCIESIANANYDKSLISHLIIDDGSIDNTRSVVKSLMKIYPHVQYFKKENGKWGSVINYVKNNKLAKSDYVVEIDSDDTVNKNFFKIINEEIKGGDVLFGGYKQIKNLQKRTSTKKKALFILYKSRSEE